MISPRAVTLFVQRKNQTDEELALLQGELSLLLGNLGVAVGASVVQRRETPDPAYYIGQGKAEEAAAAASSLEEQAQDLVEAVSVFRLGNDGAGHYRGQSGLALPA